MVEGCARGARGVREGVDGWVFSLRGLGGGEGWERGGLISSSIYVFPMSKIYIENKKIYNGFKIAGFFS